MSDAVLISRNAGEATIEMVQGDPFSLTVDVTGAGSAVTAATFTIKTRTGVSVLVLSSPSSGITINDDDTITIAITEAQSLLFNPTWHRCTLKFTLANGSKPTWIKGILDVIRKD